jgi:hypothetical protein
VARGIRGYSDEVIHCLAMGHAWDPYEELGARKPEFGARLTCLCTSCTTIKKCLVSRMDGSFLSKWHYDYSDEYKAADKDRKAGRKELIRRIENARKEAANS